MLRPCTYLSVCVVRCVGVAFLLVFALVNAAVLGGSCRQESCVFRVVAALQNQMCKTPLKMLCRLIYAL